MASLNTLSVMRHRHLCPCLSTMPKAIPSNLNLKSFIQARQRHQLLLWQCCHYSRVVAISVQRGRYMSLETIAPLSDDPIVKLPAVATA